jgi:hypothetical protein
MKLQYRSTTLLLSTFAFQLARADLSYYCEMAKDGTNMIQKAYCCDDLRPARYAENFLQGDKCTPHPSIQAFHLHSEMGMERKVRN